MVYSRMLVVRLRVPLLVVSALAGCTLTTDLSDLAGPPLAGGDAAPPVTVTDAAIDADADADAGANPDAPAGPTGCARYPSAAFCVDFEKPSSLSTGTWTTSDENATNGILGLTQTNVVSPSNAAFFDLTKVDGCSYLQLTKRLPGTFSTVTTRLDLRIEGDGIFNTVNFSVTPKLSFSLIIAFGTNRAIRFFVQRNADGVFTEPAGRNDGLDVDPFGRWLPVAITATASPAKATATIGTTTIVLPLPVDFVLKDPSSTIGPYCSDKPLRGTVDDVAITTSP